MQRARGRITLRWMRRLLPILTTLLLSGCPEPPREPASLVDHGFWEDAGEEHPFADLAAPEVERECGDLALFRELFGAEDSFSVDLDDCNYAVITQPARAEILVGDIVVWRMWRDASFFLTDEPTDIGLQVGAREEGDDIHWRGAYPNPGDSGLVYEEFEALVDVPEGAPITWFVNTHAELGARHGGNSLNFIELSRLDPRWEDE